MTQSDGEFDALVVGGGIIGLACAHRFLDEGRAVTVVDPCEAERTTSFGNAGLLAYSEIMPLASPGSVAKAPGWLFDPLGPLSVPPRYAARLTPWLLRFLLSSTPARVAASTRALTALNALARKEMERLADAAGIARMITAGGALNLYESEAEFAAARKGWAEREEAGIPSEALIGRQAIAEVQPGLSPRFSHAVFCPDGSRVTDPRDFTEALAARFRGRGGTIRRGRVVSLAPTHAGVRVSFDDGEAIEGADVVLAAGAWSKALASGLGDRVPLETERGYNTTLPPQAFDLKLPLYFGGHGFVVSPLSSGIRVGGAVELGGLDLPPRFERARAMLAKAGRFLPDLVTEGGREWMGFRPSLPDSLPVIGRSSASPHVVHAFGHGHLGLTQSAATARLVADLLADRPPAVDIAPFAPSRFG